MADDFEWQMRHRDLFGDDVDAYDVGRPGYPREVFEYLADRCGLGATTRVLEIGPGTGQATAPLLARGAQVTAVELNPQMAGRLKAKHPNVEAIATPFETADVGSEPFDLVVAATSFHWITPTVAYQRAADALKDGGWLALWWNVFGDPDQPDSFHVALVKILEAQAPELIDPGVVPYGLDAATRIRDFEKSGRFGAVEYHVIRWVGRHTSTELRTFFASQSPWLALEPTRRFRLLDEVEQLVERDFGGVVERPYLTPVYLARTVAL